MSNQKKTIGILGFGKLGQYLWKALQDDQNYEISWIWNRTKEAIPDYFQSIQVQFPSEKILAQIEDLEKRPVDLVVEVSHPNIIKQYGGFILKHSDLFVGSPTAFADQPTENRLREGAKNRAVYVPSGAFWGAEDVEKMAKRNTLGSISVTMKKHPGSLKVEEPLETKLKGYIESDAEGEFVVYKGPVRALCPLAPNNVNTMACAAIAASNLGFDKVEACLIADKSLNAHVIQIDLASPIPEGKSRNDVFNVSTTRFNPAAQGAVTGSATYVSFHSSLLRAKGQPNGVHFC